MRRSDLPDQQRAGSLTTSWATILGHVKSILGAQVTFSMSMCSLMRENRLTLNVNAGSLEDLEADPPGWKVVMGSGVMDYVRQKSVISFMSNRSHRG